MTPPPVMFTEVATLRKILERMMNTQLSRLELIERERLTVRHDDLDAAGAHQVPNEWTGRALDIERRRATWTFGEGRANIDVRPLLGNLAGQLPDSLSSLMIRSRFLDSPALRLGDETEIVSQSFVARLTHHFGSVSHRDFIAHPCPGRG